MIHLTRIDPPRNMARFYRLDIQADLIGCSRLTTEWGRIGQGGTLRNAFFASNQQAEAALHHQTKGKLRRGYTSGGSHGA